MTRKILDIVTVVTAVWACLLSTYIFLYTEAKKEPVLSSVVNVEAKQVEPVGEGEKKDLRLKVFVTNTGGRAVEVDPEMVVQIINSKYRWQREISLRMNGEDGEQLQYKIPKLLKPGEVISYSSSYRRFDDIYNPHSQYLAYLSSRTDSYVSHTPAPRSADAIEHSFTIENGAMLSHFSTVQQAPQRFVLLNEL